jgi:hypothetical protein
VSFMDDQYFGPPEAPRKGERYTAGYWPDPQPGGGYRYNFKKLDPSRRIDDTLVTPLKLPAALDTAKDQGKDPVLDSHTGRWWLIESEALPYSEALDRFPAGTRMPSILVSPFQGDRAHVSAKGEHARGGWTLEARRVLDTRSKHDVAFRMDRPVYFSVAAYNSAQTRHTEHIEPIRLDLEP